MTQLVDDQVLASLLRGDMPPKSADSVFTTGCWYVRLCQAVMNASERGGVLSGPFAAQPQTIRSRSVSRLMELPDDVGLISLRTLGPLMGELRQRHRLNLLSSEALAAAVHLRADVVLASNSPQLETALRAENLHVEVLGSPH